MTSSICFGSVYTFVYWDGSWCVSVSVFVPVSYVWHLSIMWVQRGVMLLRCRREHRLVMCLVWVFLHSIRRNASLNLNHWANIFKYFYSNIFFLFSYLFPFEYAGASCVIVLDCTQLYKHTCSNTATCSLLFLSRFLVTQIKGIWTCWTVYVP